jgi:hypothetical protein
MILSMFSATWRDEKTKIFVMAIITIVISTERNNESK